MRKNYIDWLRNICILYLFLFHTARIFDASEANYVQGVSNSFSTTLVLLSFWFMPLMFLLAGMSSYFSIQNRNNKQFIKERILRLFVPLIFGILFIMPPQGYFAEKFHFGYNGSFISYLKKFFTDFSDLSGYYGSFTPSVLWFILFLFLITLITLPIMRKLISQKPKFVCLFKSPIKIACISIPITIISALPNIGGKNIFVDASFVLLGFIIATDDEITDMLESYRLYYFIGTVIGAIIILIEINTIGWQSGFSFLGIIFSLIYFLTIWISLLAFIGYGKKYLNFRTSLLLYFSSAAFPIYIIHQTYLIIIGYYILKVTNIFIFQFIVIMLLTFAVSLLTYELIRRFKITRFLFGIKLIK